MWSLRTDSLHPLRRGSRRRTVEHIPIRTGQDQVCCSPPLDLVISSTSLETVSQNAKLTELTRFTPTCRPIPPVLSAWFFDSRFENSKQRAVDGTLFPTTGSQRYGGSDTCSKAYAGYKNHRRFFSGPAASSFTLGASTESDSLEMVGAAPNLRESESSSAEGKHIWGEPPNFLQYSSEPEVRATEVAVCRSNELTSGRVKRSESNIPRPDIPRLSSKLANTQNSDVMSKDVPSSRMTQNIGIHQSTIKRNSLPEQGSTLPIRSPVAQSPKHTTVSHAPLLATAQRAAARQLKKQKSMSAIKSSPRAPSTHSNKKKIFLTKENIASSSPVLPVLNVKPDLLTQETSISGRWNTRSIQGLRRIKSIDTMRPPTEWPDLKSQQTPPNPTRSTKAIHNAFSWSTPDNPPQIGNQTLDTKIATKNITADSEVLNSQFNSLSLPALASDDRNTTHHVHFTLPRLPQQNYGDLILAGRTSKKIVEHAVGSDRRAVGADIPISTAAELNISLTLATHETVSQISSEVINGQDDKWQIYDDSNPSVVFEKIDNQIQSPVGDGMTTIKGVIDAQPTRSGAKDTEPFPSLEPIQYADTTDDTLVEENAQQGWPSKHRFEKVYEGRMSGVTCRSSLQSPSLEQSSQANPNDLNISHRPSMSASPTPQSLSGTLNHTNPPTIDNVQMLTKLDKESFKKEFVGREGDPFWEFTGKHQPHSVAGASTNSEPSCHVSDLRADAPVFFPSKSEAMKDTTQFRVEPMSWQLGPVMTSSQDGNSTLSQMAKPQDDSRPNNEDHERHRHNPISPNHAYGSQYRRLYYERPSSAGTYRIRHDGPSSPYEYYDTPRYTERDNQTGQKSRKSNKGFDRWNKPSQPVHECAGSYMSPAYSSGFMNVRNIGGYQFHDPAIFPCNQQLGLNTHVAAGSGSTTQSANGSHRNQPYQRMLPHCPEKNVMDALEMYQGLCGACMPDHHLSGTRF